MTHQQHPNPQPTTENPYQPPKANLTTPEDIHSAQPSIIFVAGWLLGISIVVAMVGFLIENFANVHMSNTLVLLITTIVTGIISGQKYGNYMARKTRATALTIWFILGLFVAGIMVMIEPYRFLRFRESSLFPFLLLFGFLFAYGLVYMGEKLGVSINHNKR